MPLTVIHTSASAGHLEVRISRYAGVGMGLPVLVMFKMGQWALLQWASGMRMGRQGTQWKGREKN
jgi:hypothetical protein